MPISIPKLSFSGGELSPALYARVDLSKYGSGLRLCKNFIVQRHGGATNRSGLQYVCTTKDSTKNSRLIPFQFSVEQAYVLEFGDQYMRVVKDGGQVLLDAAPAAYNAGTTYGQGDHCSSGGVNYYSLVGSNTGNTPSSSPAYWYALEDDIVEIKLPYLEADLPLLKYTQSADVLYVVHPSYAPRKISRSDHDEWTVDTITFQTSVATPTSFTRSAGSGTGSSYTVTSVSDIGEESESATAVAGGAGDTFTWDDMGVDHYNVYKDANGSGVYGWIGQANDATFKEPTAGIIPDYNVTPPAAKTIFNATDEYPGVCTFFEQRLAFARTNNKPQTLWGSATGSFENMNTSSPLKDDDSYNFTINALQVNEVKSMVPLNELIIFTSGSEWKMAPGNNSNAVTPTDVQIRMQSKWGANDVPPILIGQTVLYVQNSGDVVRDLLYSLEVDGYAGNNLSLLSEHLFKDREITEWAFQQAPNSVVWCVRDDGKLLGLTYAREHEVWAWHQHETDGDFESIAANQSSTGFDDTYFIVNRTIDGSTARYIERFVPRMPNDDVEQAYFVDSGLSLDVPATITGITKADPVVITTSAAHGLSNDDYVDLRGIGGMVELLQDSDGNALPFKRYTVDNVTSTTFELQTDLGVDVDGTGFTTFTSGGNAREAVLSLSGLSHLEGETLVALANGNVVRNLTVSSGSVTLPQRASIVHIGMPFESELETMELDMTTEGGTLQDRKRDVSGVVLRLDKSRAFSAGPQSDRLEEMRFREFENYGEPIALFTGDKEMSVYAGEERSAKVFVKNSDPVPLTILAIIPRVVNGEF